MREKKKKKRTVREFGNAQALTNRQENGTDHST